MTPGWKPEFLPDESDPIALALWDEIKAVIRRRWPQPSDLVGSAADSAAAKEEIVEEVAAGTVMPRRVVSRCVDVSYAHHLRKAQDMQRLTAAGERIGQILIALNELGKVFADGGDRLLSDGQVLELHALLGEYERLIDVAERRANVDADPLISEMLVSLRWLRDEQMRLIRQRRQAVAARARQERIAHRDPGTVTEARKCSSCKRRPIMVDDLCGRCAEAAGTRPHGKIGGPS